MQNIIGILNGIYVGGNPSGGGGVIPFSGLLDAYPNAAAAYSVRQLSSTYTAPTASEFSFGNALDIRYYSYVDFSSISFSGDFTISTWVKFGSFADVIMASTSTLNFYLFTENSTAIRLSIGATAAAPDRLVFTVPAMTTGTWYYLTISRISNSVRLYLNSVESSTLAITSSNTFNLNRWSGYGAPGFEFFGVIDEALISNTTGATQQNVTDLYNSGNGALASTIIPSPTAYWRMNESGTDTTLADETGNYNGTLNGFILPGAWVNGKANNGALVEIRRESDDTTKSFYSDSNNELSLTSPDVNGVTLGTWIGSSDGFVRTWYDQSGNSIDFIQATTSEQPKIITSGAFTLESGKPVMTFDGTDDYFTATLSAASTNAYHSLANYKALSVPTVGSTTIGSEGSNDKRYWYRDTTDSRIRNGGASEGVFTYLSSNSLVQIIYDGTTTVDVYENNSALQTGTISGSSSTEEIWIGEWASTGRPMNFSLSEFIDWQDDDDTRVSGVKTNQNNYYNIYSPPGGIGTFIIGSTFTIT